METIILPIQESQRTPRTRNMVGGKLYQGISKSKYLKPQKEHFKLRNTFHSEDKDFSSETMQDNGQWSNIFKILKEKK